jgi:hypothetical protein
MSLPTEADILWARDRVNRLRPGQISRFAAFRDGLPMARNILRALDLAGLVAELKDGTYVALPGVMDAFNARYGPPLVVCHEVRLVGGDTRESKAAVFAAIPAAQGFVSVRVPPPRPAERPRPDGQAHPGAGNVALPPAGQPGVHPWHGSRVIPGENTIGEIVQKLRRST